MLGVYTLNNRMFVVWLMIEKYMRMAHISSNGSWGDMLGRPVAVFFVIVAALFVVVPLVRKLMETTKKAK